MRVAAFATWPGKIESGKEIEAAMHMVDWHPTLLLKLAVRCSNNRYRSMAATSGRRLRPGPLRHTKRSLLNATPTHGAIRLGDARRRRSRARSRRLGAREHGALARQLRHQHLAPVADHLGLDVLERARVGAHAGDVHPALVRERVAAHVGLVGVRRDVADLVHQVGGLGERGELLGVTQL